MFGATRDGQSGQNGGSQGRSLISSDLQVEGEIESRGSVEVLGTVRGNIRASDVSVAESGRVTGSINAGTAVLRGEIKGEIAADSINIHASARIEADITYAAIGIEYGANVKGGLRQREGTRPASPPPTPAPAKADAG